MSDTNFLLHGRLRNGMYHTVKHMDAGIHAFLVRLSIIHTDAAIHALLVRLSIIHTDAAIHAFLVRLSIIHTDAAIHAFLVRSVTPLFAAFVWYTPRKFMFYHI